MTGNKSKTKETSAKKASFLSINDQNSGRNVKKIEESLCKNKIQKSLRSMAEKQRLLQKILSFMDEYS